MCGHAWPSVAILMSISAFALTGCTQGSNTEGAQDVAMMSHPNLYRGAQYHPHPWSLNIHQAELDLAPGVAYKGCVAVLRTSMQDADAGRGVDCGSTGRISFDAGVRYGDCTALRRITLAEATTGSGLLCDADADQVRAAVERLRVSAAQR
jgi:hypothetical protein